MDTITEEELELLLFTKEEEQFMVVPELEESLLGDLLSEDSFNDLTVTSGQNPSVVFVVDVDRTSGNRNSVDNENVFNGDGSADSRQFIQFNQQQQPFSSIPSDNNFKLFAPRSQFPQAAISELADPTSTWIAQRADITLLERLVSESDRFRSVDDILDIVPSESAPAAVNYSAESSPVLDKNQILEEIYREAEEISSRNGSPFTNDGYSSPMSQVSVDSLDSYQPSNVELKNFDHTFGTATLGKRKRKDSSGEVIKKSKSEQVELLDQAVVGKFPKREVAKLKKRHQNREAAVRYRLKKRAEKMATGEELQIQMDRNEFLKTQKSNLAAEIGYLRGLLSEVNKMKQSRVETF
jgi:hypothetical protein